MPARNVDWIWRAPVLSDDGLFRYSLDRWWGQGAFDERSGRAVWVLLNPSTADGLEDDPTVRRCIAFTLRLRYASMTIVNLFAFRATDPARLRLLPAEGFEGPENRETVTAAISAAAVVIAGWGAAPATLNLPVPSWLPRAELECLGTTKAGHPRHPLYVAASQPLVPWHG